MTEGAEVELLWIEKHIERWIRFGIIAAERIIDRRRRVVIFAPSSVFAFISWQGNAHGTIESRIDILRAVATGESYSSIPCVAPGAESLLRLSGWPKVTQVLRAIDAIEALNIGAETVCPDHWRHVMNRISAGERPAAYTHERHEAWLKRCGAQAS